MWQIVNDGVYCTLTSEIYPFGWQLYLKKPMKPEASAGMLQEVPAAAAVKPLTASGMLSYSALGIPGNRHFWRGDQWQAGELGWLG